MLGKGGLVQSGSLKFEDLDPAMIMHMQIGYANCTLVQSCMSFTEKIVVAKISVKVMNSSKVMPFI